MLDPADAGAERPTLPVMAQDGKLLPRLGSDKVYAYKGRRERFKVNERVELGVRGPADLFVRHDQNGLR